AVRRLRGHVDDVIDVDGAHVVEMVEVVPHLDRDEPRDEQREHGQAQAAGPRGDRQARDENRRQERGRHRNHVPVEEEAESPLAGTTEKKTTGAATVRAQNASTRRRPTTARTTTPSAARTVK